MHRYAVTSDNSPHVELYLAGASVLLAWGFSQLLPKTGIVIPWWLESPSVMGFYGLLHQWFDRRLWRLPLSRALGFVCIPDLSGTWKGRLTSSFDQLAEEVEVSAVIWQTWSRIAIQFSTASSRSESEAATIVSKPGDGALVIYEYLSTPLVGSIDTMHAHRGTARLEFAKEGERLLLSGEYYTGRDRQNFGAIYLTRELPSHAPDRRNVASVGTG